MLQKQKYIFFFILSILFLSCQKEKTKWDVDVLGPLIKTRLNLENIIPDSMLGTGPDSCVLLILDKEFFRLEFDSIFEKPQALSSFTFSLPIQFNVPPGATLISKTETNKFDFGDADISHCIVNKGNIKIRCENPIDEDILVNYEIPSATKNGNIFSISVVVPPLSIGNNIYETSFNIDGYSLDLTAASSSINKLITKYTIKTLPSGDTTLFTPTDTLKVDLLFEELEIAFIKGYFGRTSLETENDTASIDIFSIIQSGSLNMEDIFAKIIIENGLGIDAQMLLKSFTAKNTQSGNSLALNDPIIGKNINVSRAVFNGFNTCNPVTPSISEIDLSNSNLLNLLELFPDELIYSVGFVFNPMGNISAGNDFMHHSKTLSANLYAEIPLAFKANNFVLADYTDVSISGDSTLIERECEGNLKIYADNMFPFDASLQLYLLNENLEIQDSVFSDYPIIQAATDFSGTKIQSPKKSIIKVPINPDKIRLLYKTKKAYVKLIFHTANSNFIKVYPDYFIDLQIIADINLLVY